ncbi:MAG: acetyl-CoA hydrolase [Xanthomonadales bacterium]|nr:acetyl-CoA hydrolase [Xanthomonadales bacterium]
MSNIIDTVEEAVERTIAAVGPHLILATPLGLGKPVQLINAFYRRVAADPELRLDIFTALSLDVPRPSSDLEARLAGPILERIFGDYEPLDYVAPLKRGRLPDNITVSEFYLKAGSMKGNAVAQQHYVSSNYTHVVRDMLARGVNVLAQMVAARESDEGTTLSLSCNTDLTLEVLRHEVELDHPIMSVAQVHGDLPFMELDAQVPVDSFDLVVDNRDYDRRIFAVPNAAVPLRDYAAGLHASSLILDGGTLQIGIGALGDAVAHACILRHRDNAAYRRLLAGLGTQPAAADAASGPFKQGLYVSTEMFVNGMMHLIEQGVVKRKVYDDLVLQRGINAGAIDHYVDLEMYDFLTEEGFIPATLDAASLARLQRWGLVDDSVSLAAGRLLVDGAELDNDLTRPAVRGALLRQVEGRELRQGRVLHGGFYLGPRDFYDKLRALDARGRAEICMTGVSRTNQLLLDYPLYSAQRRHARFINTGMMVTLSGAVASDALEDGTAISGVGGQYNFVAMAHDLPGARSVLCIRATRGEGEDTRSNIVPFYGHLTIPKHLRDIVVTEYGVADLRGQNDAEVIKRLVNIADSRFQDELLAFARKHGKVEAGYRVPAQARKNTPERLRATLGQAMQDGLLPEYPFGTELTEREQVLAASLRHVKSLSESPADFIGASFRALLHNADDAAAQPFLERIQLQHPETTRDFLVQQLLLLDLEERGLLKVN